MLARQGGEVNLGSFEVLIARNRGANGMI